MARARCWSITLHNYTEDDEIRFKSIFESNCKEWVIGKELGKSGETPHLQIYVYFENPKTMSAIKKLLDNNTIHCEIAKNINALRNYCKKEGNYTETQEHSSLEDVLNEDMNEIYKDVNWKDWQQNVLDIVSNKPDDRKIYWFWERHGNVGKSFLVKFLCWKMNALLIGNKEADSIYSIKSYIDDKKKYPKIILMDIPRSRLEHINYGCIENIKNGTLFSGKYESCNLIIPRVHIVIFANEMPSTMSMSKDRWNIIEI